MPDEPLRELLVAPAAFQMAMRIQFVSLIVTTVVVALFGPLLGPTLANYGALWFPVAPLPSGLPK
jgi:hypothetical protein